MRTATLPAHTISLLHTYTVRKKFVGAKAWLMVTKFSTISTSNLLNCASNRALNQRHQSRIAKSAKTFLTVYTSHLGTVSHKPKTMYTVYTVEKSRKRDSCHLLSAAAPRKKNFYLYWAMQGNAVQKYKGIVCFILQ